MQAGEIAARRCRDDGDRIEFLAVRPGPGFRQPGETDRGAIAAMDEAGPLALAGSLPFIIAVRRDQAAPPSDRVLEGRFFLDGLRTGVDQQREITGVLDPGRQHAPAHQPEMPDAVVDDHHGYGLRRRNIMSWQWTLPAQRPTGRRRAAPRVGVVVDRPAAAQRGQGQDRRTRGSDLLRHRPLLTIRPRGFA